MTHHPRDADRERAFRTLYERLYGDLVRFVQRRAHPDHAPDVVAEAFLVVWRRFGDVPADPDDARAWVFGIARHVLLNARRAELRRAALGVRLAAGGRDRTSDAGDEVAARLDLVRAWRLLSEVHQEALALAVLDGLRAPQAAAVLGISPVAFRLRLSRARRALRLHLDHLPRPSGVPAGARERTATP